MQKRKNGGFTIIELMISLAVGLGLLAGVLAVFVGMKTTSSDTAGYGEVQENGRFALTILTDDLLKQNFWGDYSAPFVVNEVTVPVNLLGLATDCTGDGVNNASFPGQVGSFRTIWGRTTTQVNNMNCIDNAVVGSDILQLKRVIASPVAAGDLNGGRYYWVAAPSQAAVIPGTTAAGDIPVINGSRIWEYQHHIYYIRNDVQGSGSQQINVPVLMQGRLQNAAQVMTFEPLVDGIENIRFMYGVDTNNDNIVNSYVSADNMTQGFWDNELNTSILAVKVYVLARSILPDAKYTNTNTYQLGDQALTFNDNYRRLLFSSTVTLFNAKGDTW